MNKADRRQSNILGWYSTHKKDMIVIENLAGLSKKFPNVKISLQEKNTFINTLLLYDYRKSNFWNIMDSIYLISRLT